MSTVAILKIEVWVGIVLFALSAGADDLTVEAEARCLERGHSLPTYEFTTDVCSWSPDGTWGACCVAHDMDYWCGGSYWERIQSDARLAQCVGGPRGFIMNVVVRAMGAAILPTPFRWGYGRTWPEAE